MSVSEKEIEEISKLGLEDKRVSVPRMTLRRMLDMMMGIDHASHFEWREAALACARPELKPMDIALKYWEIVGHDTAKAYFYALNASSPTFEKDVARAITVSALAMGEDTKFIEGRTPKEAWVRWDRCPWREWHRRYNAVEECRPGCDKWMEAIINDLNIFFGKNLRWATLRALPEGDDCCLRRIWTE